MRESAPAARPRRARRRVRGRVGALAAALSLLALPAFAQANVEGQWSPVVPWPMIPIHAAVLPDGKLLTTGATPADGHGGFDFDVWDPKLGTGAAAHVTKPNVVATDSFCASQVLQPWSGEIMFAGGGSADPGTTVKTARFSWKTKTLAMAEGEGLSLPRWYSTMTTLPDGRVMINGGVPAYGGAHSASKMAELYAPGLGWRALPGTAYPPEGPNLLLEKRYWYPRVWPVAGDKLFVLTGKVMYRMGYEGAGSTEGVRAFDRPNWGGSSSAAMFAPGRIIQFGGGAGGNDDPAPAGSKAASVIDVRGSEPVVTDTAAMRFGRHWPSATILPTGEVLATGGSAGNNGYNYTAATAALAAEVWNPASGEWRTLAAMAVPRLYHSTAILLPDGRVFSGGGGVPGPVTARNAEIFSPPYLFDAAGAPAARPVVSTEPGIVRLGQAFTVFASGPSPIARFTLVKTGAITHGVNMDQRFLEVPFTARGNGQYALSMTADPVDATPGYYMLFAIDARGVPSVARMLRVPSPTADNGEAPPASETETAGNGGGGGTLPGSGAALLAPVGSSLCMGPKGGSTAINTPMALESCGAAAWTFTAVAGGYRVSDAADMCLDTATGTTAGAPLTQWGCDGTQEQVFTLAAQAGGTAIVSRKTGLCLDASSGTAVKQAVCVAGAPAQAWVARAATTTPPTEGPTPPTGALPLLSATGPIGTVHSGLCLQAAGGSAADGANIVQARCTGRPEQVWTPKGAQGATTLVNERTGKCMDVFGGSTAVGARLVQWSCDGSAEQRFSARARGQGWEMVNARSSLCLQVAGGSRVINTALVQARCTGATGSLFVPPPPPVAVPMAAAASQ